MQSAASAANQRLNTPHTGAWPAPPAGEPRYHAPTEHCRKLMVASIQIILPEIGQDGQIQRVQVGVYPSLYSLECELCDSCLQWC